MVGLSKGGALLSPVRPFSGCMCVRGGGAGHCKVLGLLSPLADWSQAFISSDV